MQTGEIIMYQTEDGQTSIDVKLEKETVWLSQAQMVILFSRDVSVISRHIQNIFKEQELNKKSNLHFLQIANSDKRVAFYLAKPAREGLGLFTGYLAGDDITYPIQNYFRLLLTIMKFKLAGILDHHSNRNFIRTADC